MQNEDGWTPLHEACCLSSTDVVDALLKHGADPKACCKDGTTPLHKAARAGSKAVVFMLLQAGADVSAVDKVQRLLQSTEVQNFQKDVYLQKQDPPHDLKFR